ncbi:hypothetical protein ACI7RC_23560 [Brevibacillus sp. B_LB10_24]|uniref:hypothetical protein n=1 Tax=Brevibacillus sp. B_LB10_24 TaxID=3380645 RepID=UPI0038BCF2DD
MGPDFLLLLIICGVIGVFAAVFLLGMFLSLSRDARNRRRFPTTLWNTWRQAVNKQEDSKWDHLLKTAGQPFGWGKAEWLAIQWMLGAGLLVLTLCWALFHPKSAASLLAIGLIPAAGFLLPLLVLKWWAGYREEVLSVDIARFINRYVNLIENSVPPYSAMVKAARATRKLKDHLPSLSQWNEDRFAALERFKADLGTDDAALLVSNMRTVEKLTTEVVAVTMQRLEWAVDHRRHFRHRKKIKSLGIGYSIIVYPAFYIGLIVAMFPWYKLLIEILEKYLV